MEPLYYIVVLKVSETRDPYFCNLFIILSAGTSLGTSIDGCKIPNQLLGVSVDGYKLTF